MNYLKQFGPYGLYESYKTMSSDLPNVTKIVPGATSGMTSIKMFLASGVLTCIVQLIETRFPTVSMVKAMYGEAGDDIFV